MYYLVPIPKQFVDNSGVPYSGGKVYVYNAGDTTLANIYSSASSDELVPNPFTLDSSGSWQCFVNADEPLDYVVKDTQGNVVAHFENVVPGGDGSGNVARTTVTSEDGSIDIQESYSEETRIRRFDLAISDSVVSSARFSETGALASSSGTYDYSSLTESRIVGNDILLRDGHLALNRGTYHLTLSILLENSSVDDSYYTAVMNVLGVTSKALWDNSFIHSESIEFSLDIVVDEDNTAVVPGISGLPSGISCGLSNMDIHKICVGPKGDRGEVGPMPELDQSVPDNSESTESAPSTAAVFDFAISGVKVNGVELEKDADKKVDVPVPTASSTTPAMDGVASAGNEEHWAKGDHVHPTDTSREAVSNKVTSWGSTLSDTHYPSEKLVKDTIDNLPPGTAVKGDAESEYRTGNVNLTPANIGAYSKTESDSRYKAVQTPVSDPAASGSGLSFIDSVSQDANGEITPNKKTVQDGTTSQKGVVQLSNAINSTSTTEAATPKAVKDAYDELNNKIVARAVFLSQQEWAAQSQLPGDPAKVYYVEDGTGEDAYTVYVWKESTSAYVEVDESSIDLDGYWHDGPSSSGTGNVVTGMSLGNDGVPVLEKNLTAATLDSNGTVPVSQIPDSVKDKIVYIDGTATLNTSTGVFALTVPDTTFASISTIVNAGKLPLLRVTVNNGNSYLKLYYKGLMSSGSQQWHSFGATDNFGGNPCTTDAKVYNDNTWVMDEKIALNYRGDGSYVTTIPTTENNYTKPTTATKLSVLFGKLWYFISSLRPSTAAGGGVRDISDASDTEFPSEKAVATALNDKLDSVTQNGIANLNGAIKAPFMYKVSTPTFNYPGWQGFFGLALSDGKSYIAKITLAGQSSTKTVVVGINTTAVDVRLQYISGNPGIVDYISNNDPDDTSNLKFFKSDDGSGNNYLTIKCGYVNAYETCTATVELVCLDYSQNSSPISAGTSLSTGTWPTYAQNLTQKFVIIDAVNTPTFSEAASRVNLVGSGETMPTILGKIKKWFADLGSAAFKTLVTTWSSTTSDSNIPSEKLVKAALDGKVSGPLDQSVTGNTGSTTTAPCTKAVYDYVSVNGLRGYAAFSNNTNYRLLGYLDFPSSNTTNVSASFFVTRPLGSEYGRVPLIAMLNVDIRRNTGTYAFKAELIKLNGDISNVLHLFYDSSKLYIYGKGSASVYFGIAVEPKSVRNYDGTPLIEKWHPYINAANEASVSYTSLTLTTIEYAPKNHASTGTEYGIATASNYGHVKTQNRTGYGNTRYVMLKSTDGDGILEKSSLIGEYGDRNNGTIIIIGDSSNSFFDTKQTALRIWRGANYTQLYSIGSGSNNSVKIPNENGALVISDSETHILSVNPGGTPGSTANTLYFC